MLRGVVGSVFISVALSLLFAGAVGAAQDNVWQSNQNFNVSEFTAPEITSPCVAFPAPVMQQNGKTQIKPVCAERGENLSLGTFSDDDGTKRYAIKIGTDSVYRQIGNISAKRNSLYLRPDNNTIIVKTTGSAVSPRMYVLRLEDGVFVPEMSDTGISVWEYNIDHTKRVPLLGVDNNGTTQYRMIADYIVSPDRMFVLAWLDYQVAVLVDTETFEERVIGRENGSQYGGFYNPRPAAVTDDGRYAFFAHRGVVYDTQDCGDAYEYRFSEKQFVINSPCDRTELASVINPLVHYPSSKFYAAYRFIDDGNAIQIDYPEEKPTVRYHVETGAYQPRQLEYLALGDSYSSGEGDTEQVIDGSGVKWYRDWTDNDEDRDRGIPEEKCHVSPRSYPYLLAKEMGLKMNSEWQTVACSAATAWDIKGQGSKDYLGQSDRLEGYDVGQFKATALNEFIPGRQKQIEFVKKYQPKVITLTMGGNDVDFGGRIIRCAALPDTCNEAELAWRGKVRNEIRAQFDNLGSLYDELASVSPSSKIYVLGYPQFINGDPKAHCQNTFLLNSSEREFIVNSIIYLNNIIQAAAESAGITYVDTENSIGGHRLCDENEKHITAITNIIGANKSERQEGFHPNSLGHRDIALDVQLKLGTNELRNYPACRPSGVTTCSSNIISAESAIVPPYFQVTDADSTRLIYYKLTNGTLVKTEPKFDLIVGEYTYQPSSKVELTLYSSPTHLGSYVAAVDGSLRADIEVPDGIQAGYHTLVASGLSFSGEEVELYQTVLIAGGDTRLNADDAPLDRREGEYAESPNAMVLAAAPLSVANNQVADPAIHTENELNMYVAENSYKKDISPTNILGRSVYQDETSGEIRKKTEIRKFAVYAIIVMAVPISLITYYTVRGGKAGE